MTHTGVYSHREETEQDQVPQGALVSHAGFIPQPMQGDDLYTPALQAKGPDFYPRSRCGVGTLPHDAHL